jgi:hypothetical protein
VDPLPNQTFDKGINGVVKEYGFLQTDDWIPTGLPTIPVVDDDELAKFAKLNGYTL